MTQSVLALEPMRFKCQYRHHYQQNIHLNFLISEKRRNGTPELSSCSRAGSENVCGDIMRAKLALFGRNVLWRVFISAGQP